MDSSGKRVRNYETFESKREAEKAFNVHKVKIDTQNFVMPQTMTLGEWLNYWLENIIKPRSAATTIYGYQKIINKDIIPSLGQINLQKLKPKEIQDYLSHLSNERKLSPNTIIKHYDLLITSLNTAVKQEYLFKNPVQAVEPPKKVKNEAKVYTAEQLGHLLTIIQGTRLEVPVMLCSYYGLRRGELMGLRWQDVDFEKRVIHISNTRTTAGKEIVEKDTKTDASTRKLAIPDTIALFLKEEKQRQDQRRTDFGDLYVDTDYIIVMEDGKPYRPNYISELFDKFLRENNMPKIVLHELRHTFASLSNEAGVPEFNIGKALGHSTPAITKKIFTHLFDQTLSSAINQVANIVDNAIKAHEDLLEEKAITQIKKIQNVINEWDPVGAIAKSGNKDEYTDEIRAIATIVAKTSHVPTLGKAILKYLKPLLEQESLKKQKENVLK